jgi:hypothetical protein
MTSGAPFLIMGLPRSRTVWLSHYLSKGRLDVGHDLATTCGSLDEFVAKLYTKAGSVETGAMLGWRALREAIPELRLILVRRPLEGVVNSLGRTGVQVDHGMTTELIRRDGMLDAAMLSPGVRTVQFHEINLASHCKWLFETCREEPWDRQWWESLRYTNIQANMQQRLLFLNQHRAELDNFKREVEVVENELALPKSCDGLVIQLESWQTCGAEADALGKAHFSEVGGPDEPARKYELDQQVFDFLSRSGAMRFSTARLDGKLIGYCSWNVELDPECLGTLVARQGAWFVEPGAPARAAIKLYNSALADLQLMGVTYCYPHHRIHGRGSDLGKFFSHLGAIKIQDEYSLDLRTASVGTALKVVS